MRCHLWARIPFDAEKGQTADCFTVWACLTLTQQLQVQLDSTSRSSQCDPADPGKMLRSKKRKRAKEVPSLHIDSAEDVYFFSVISVYI